jgi:hypothetical protein
MSTPGRDRVSAFCIDFNWDALGRFASPGLYAHADPKQHVDWYEQLGVNTIQSFFVSHNGYAWYDSDVAPRTPGMKGPFFGELAELAAARGMDVMGYFSPGANEWWRRHHPEESHTLATASSYWHIPFTNRYLDYQVAQIADGLSKVPVKGFMVDFLWNVEPTWLPCEREMYAELMGEQIGEALPDAEATAEYGRRAVERAWRRIKETADAFDPNLILWLTANNLAHTQIADTKVGSEIDWLMNEAPDAASLARANAIKGEHTKIIQCVCGWGEMMAGQTPHDASSLLQDDGVAQTGVYGFARPSEVTTLPDASAGSINHANIEAFRRHLHGATSSRAV